MKFQKLIHGVEFEQNKGDFEQTKDNLCEQKNSSIVNEWKECNFWNVIVER